MPVLTGVDILGIQRYVFGSHHLRDVLAASWMVDHVTRREQLDQWPSCRPSSVRPAAGGNAFVEFTSLEVARTWAAHYSRWLQDTAPGLDAVVVHRVYEARPLAWAFRVLQVDIARAKLERMPGKPQLGLSVTASCSITGLPATSVDQGTLVAPNINQLRSRVQSARERWADFVPAMERVSAWTADFPDEIDHMGRTRGQSSLVGVVHVDGNGVGRLIRRWLDRCTELDIGDQAVRTQYREWSDAIADAGRAALGAAISRTAACIEVETDHCVLRGSPFELGYRLHDWRDDRIHRRGPRTVLLPLRPILLGGDDITFLCDGRVALDLAVTTLQELGRHPIPHLGENGAQATLTGCAGVALVKPHAPFHRSYELAEELCASAKRARVDANEQTMCETGSWIDWHLGATRPGETILEIRGRAYSRGNNILSMRPYPIVEITHRSQSWEWLDHEVLGPSVSPEGTPRGLRGAECWVGSRSRVKTLGYVVSNGAPEVQRQIEAWRDMESRPHPPVLPGRLDDGGYLGNRTPLLDAIELLDLHMRLDPDSRQAERIAKPVDASTEEDTSR